MAQAQKVQVCNWCESEENVFWYCTNCNENLCDSCKGIHLKAQKLKNDKIIPIKEARNIFKTAVSLCGCHPSEQKKFYCYQCEEEICAICLNDSHQDHKWTLLDKYVSTKRDALKSVTDKLKVILSTNQQVATTEESNHGSLVASIEENQDQITIQEARAKEKISVLCNEYHSMLSTLNESENKRHENIQNQILNKNQKIQQAIFSSQRIAESGSLIQMIEAEKDVIQLLEENTEYHPPKTIIPNFKPVDITDHVILNVIGILGTDDEDQKDENSSQEQTKEDEEVEDCQGSEEETENCSNGDEDCADSNEEENDENAQRNREDTNEYYQSDENDEYYHRIEEVSILGLSLIKLQSKTQSIRSIVSVDENRSWVVADLRELTLIDDQGYEIKRSATVKEGENIFDVKMYNNDLILTCFKGQKVLRMSDDGDTITTFCDLSPFYTGGLCTGYQDDVLVVCRECFDDDMEKDTEKESVGDEDDEDDDDTNSRDGNEINDNEDESNRDIQGSNHGEDDTCDSVDKTMSESKVVRLDKSGQVVQIIQCDGTGNPLFSAPFYITTLPTGEVIVTDETVITIVDEKGEHMLTLKTSQIDGENESDFNAWCVTHDQDNNIFVSDFFSDKIYVFGIDGRGSKCLLSADQDMDGPMGIEIDQNRQLLVGCWGWKIHAIRYK